MWCCVLIMITINNVIITVRRTLPYVVVVRKPHVRVYVPRIPFACGPYRNSLLLFYLLLLLLLLLLLVFFFFLPFRFYYPVRVFSASRGRNVWNRNRGHRKTPSPVTGDISLEFVSDIIIVRTCIICTSR